MISWKGPVKLVLIGKKKYTQEQYREIIMKNVIPLKGIVDG